MGASSVCMIRIRGGGVVTFACASSAEGNICVTAPKSTATHG